MSAIPALAEAALPLSRSLDLLARAALAPLDEAVVAWRTWRSEFDIDATPWAEVRMLGAVAPRIEQLEPDSLIRPRVGGIRKFLWVNSQMCLKTAIGGLAALNRADVPLMLMKGAARIARDPGSAQERLIRDVDVLVPLGQEAHAFSVLEADGWGLVPEPWQISRRQLAPVAGLHAWSLKKGEAEIDLHHFSNNLNRLAGDDDGLWSRGESLRWSGAEVMVPSPADALLMAIVHGVRWSVDGAADWTVDACGLLDQDRIDWSVFVAETRNRLLQVAALTGLRYLETALGREIPEAVSRDLATGVTPLLVEEFRQYSIRARAETPAEVHAASSCAIQRAFMRRPPRGQPAGAARVRVGRVRATARPGPVWTAFTLPALEDGADGWLILEIRIAALPEDQAASVSIDLTTYGLQLPSQRANRQSPSPGDAAASAYAAVVGIPESLLQLRHVGLLGLRFDSDRPGEAREVHVMMSRLAEASPRTV